jgi:hypothetical protein
MHGAETLIAAIHRDWGEAQGNYDEFRFFTGLRPFEQIALALTENGIISINKANSCLHHQHGNDQGAETGERRDAIYGDRPGAVGPDGSA